jgi:hypothetical protein
MSARLLKLSLLAATFAMSTSAVAEPPATVEQAICRPLFQVDRESLSAVTAFVLDLPAPDSRTLLVSAIHLFVPDGGMKEQIAAMDLARRVTGVQCKALTSNEAWHAGHALTIPEARPLARKFQA